MVKFQPSKLAMRVRFPLPAHPFLPSQNGLQETSLTWMDVLTYGSDHMASIAKDTHQPPKSPYWIACFTGADGRRLKKSTKTTDPKLARKLADEWEQLAKAGRAGRLTESQCRK